jgi:ankyrin repeat protein
VNSLKQTFGVMLILDRGLFDVNEPTPFGFTPLMFAAKQNSLGLARLLLSKGAMLDSANIRGGTALMNASNFGLRKMTELLVEAGANLEAQDIDGKTALHLAAYEQHVAVVQALIRAGASSKTRMVDGQTPLHLACVHGNMRIIELLVGAGAEAGAGAGTGAECVLKWVPIGVAAREGHLDAVRFMISHVGVARCGGDAGGIQALEAAARCGHVEVLRVLTDSGVRDNGTALLSAVGSARHGCVRLLLRQYEKLALSHINTATDAMGRTALACAMGKSSKIFQWLLETGADATQFFFMNGLHIPPLTIIDTLAMGASVESDKQRLKAVRRTLLQVPALQSVSWTWEQHATASTHRIVPIAMPVVRRRRRETSRVVLGGLAR